MSLSPVTMSLSGWGLLWVDARRVIDLESCLGLLRGKLADATRCPASTLRQGGAQSRFTYSEAIFEHRGRSEATGWE
jgi:hypothetical protein